MGFFKTFFVDYNPFALMHAAIIKGLAKKVHLCPNCYKILKKPKKKRITKCPKCKIKINW